jgi:hypothetical protein
VDASVSKTNEDDAGTTNFNRLSASGLEALRAAAIELLLDRPIE